MSTYALPGQGGDFVKGASGPASVYDTSPTGLGISPAYLAQGASATATASSGGAIVAGTRTTAVSSSGTTFAGGTDILASALSFTADGTSVYMVTVNAPYWTNTTTAENELRLNLDGIDDGTFAQDQITSPTNAFLLSARGAFSPVAGVHTVNVRFTVSAGSGSIGGGTGGGGNVMAIVVRVEKL